MTKRPWNRRITSFLGWSYLCTVVAAVALLWLAGDRWWVATLLTFGPRWVMLAPLSMLVPLAVFFNRRALAPLIAAAALVAGPFMGLCLSWRGSSAAPPPERNRVLRVVTYNCGAGGSDMRVIAEYIRQVQPDIFVLNEWERSEQVPAGLGDGWHVAQSSPMVLSRFPIRSFKKLGPEGLRNRWRAPALRCELDTPWGTISVVGVHLDTPREGLQEVLFSPWRAGPEMNSNTENRRIESELASQLAGEAQWPVIIAGDFNMPVDSTIYRRFWSGWQNAFSRAGFGYGYTKFTDRWGVRIDHVLSNRGWQIRTARVGPDLGGDHRPLLVELLLKEQ